MVNGVHPSTQALLHQKPVRGTRRHKTIKTSKKKQVEPSKTQETIEGAVPAVANSTSELTIPSSNAVCEVRSTRVLESGVRVEDIQMIVPQCTIEAKSLGGGNISISPTVPMLRKRRSEDMIEEAADQGDTGMSKQLVYVYCLNSVNLLYS